MNSLRNYIAFIIFLEEYWLDGASISDLSPKEIESYYTKWNTQWLPEQNSKHSGDCVKAPAPCTRCHVEELLKSADKVLQVIGKNKNINIK